MSDYMGTTDDEKRAWLVNFRDQLQLDSAAYDVTSADVANVATVVDGFVDALAVVQTPNGRNPGTTAAKNDARQIAVQTCRQLAMLIKMNGGVTDQKKIDAGIRPVNHSRTPIPGPVDQAVIAVLFATFGAHTLRYLDPDGGESSRKPFGVTNLQIYRGIAEEAIADVDQTAFYHAFRKNPIPSAFDHVDDGKVATYFARWADAKGQVGPWSQPVSLRIAA